jgi:hypothetical protein
MTQLQDPQQALRQIQDVGTGVEPGETAGAASEPEASAAPAAEPAVDSAEDRTSLPVAPAAPEAATDASGDRDTIIPVVVTVEEEQQDSSGEPVAEASAETDDRPEQASAAAGSKPARPGLSEEEWADFQRGLLLVDLTSATAPPSR